MGELSILLKQIKEDKDSFSQLLERMEPLINKYTRLLYKDDKEDVRSELMLSLWEAVVKMEYFDNDGKCITFLCNALRNKFFELYKKSKKQHNYQCSIEQDKLLDITVEEYSYTDIVIREDIRKLLGDCSEKKKAICCLTLFGQLSDKEIAKKYNISRQYVYRVRMGLYSKLREEYLV